jgi:type II secretory pathway predicted ATPase ExeA
MPAAAALKQEYRYMPLKLKGVLARLGIRQTAWAAGIKQSDGKPLSLSAATQIMNWDTWPKLTPKEKIQRQTEKLLREHGADEVDIATIWEEDNEDLHRSNHPSGCHLGQKPGRMEPVIEPMETEMLSPEAKKLFSIFRDPFSDDVQSADDIFLSADQRYIREAMFSTAKHGGFLAVVGESGAGKTVLRRDLIDRVNRESHPITVIQPRLIDKGTLTAGSICEAIIDDLRPGEKVKRSLEGKARQVEKLLTDSSRAGNTHVLLIEEAHDLSINTLKYLKRFWELEDGFKKLLSIILVGQPELKSKLDERQNYEAREVIRRCEIVELQPLDRHLEAYLSLKFKRLGSDIKDVFAPDAFDAIRARLTRQRRGAVGDVTSMVHPLMVNNLVTKAMNLCAKTGAPKVSADVVKEI